MSEPHVPEPAPEKNSNWDPEPARCWICNSIVDVRYEAGAFGPRARGFCSTHGLVEVKYAPER